MTPRSLLAPARLGGQPILRAQTDDRLVQLARSGSMSGFEAIVARYRRPLVAYSARFVGQERAEDAVQQTFVKAYTALTAGEPVLNLRPWLYRITHNTSLNMLRDRALQHEQLSDQIDGVERPDQVAERRQELTDVLAAVKALPERQRDAIVLRAIEGRSYEQIAESLGVTDGAVRQLLSRARCGVRAGVAAVTPVGLVARIAAPFGDAPVAMMAGSGGGGGGFAVSKVAAAALAAAIAGGGATSLPDGAGERVPAADEAAAATPKPRMAAARRPSAGGLAVAATRPTRGTGTTATKAPSRTSRPAGQGEGTAREVPRADPERRTRRRRGPDGERRHTRDGAEAPRDGRRDMQDAYLPPDPTLAPDGLDPRRRLGGPEPTGDAPTGDLDGAHSAASEGPYDGAMR